MPGQTCAGVRERSRGWAAFNGGPDNCPAKPRSNACPVGSCCAFNGGPDNCPAKPVAFKWRVAMAEFLQWRAGQLPGQTGLAQIGRGALIVPSMEGRTIARPNNSWGFAVDRFPTSFNGGPDNCPAKPVPGGMVAGGGVSPSMEGRTIARPNDSAGTAGRAPNPPSMEGRTIARPNPAHGSASAASVSALQWRAGQLPGQTTRGVPETVIYQGLQWRAGQLPGQTRQIHHPPEQKEPAFNGGPDNCPAKPDRPPTPRARWCPFNGGPDNCPAKPSYSTVVVIICRHLQWRAGQLPGQTSRARS